MEVWEISVVVVCVGVEWARDQHSKLTMWCVDHAGGGSVMVSEVL